MKNSHKTARVRSQFSVPMKYICTSGLLKGRCLDYGCGRGSDAAGLGIEKYDPYYYNIKPKGKFDTITCIYVLNVVSKKEQDEILSKIKRLLNKGGKAYFAVRRDIEKTGWNQRGTYQRIVKLPFKLLKETSTHAIYEYENA